MRVACPVIVGDLIDGSMVVYGPERDMPARSRYQSNGVHPGLYFQSGNINNETILAFAQRFDGLARQAMKHIVYRADAF